MVFCLLVGKALHLHVHRFVACRHNECYRCCGLWLSLEKRNAPGCPLRLDLGFARRGSARSIRCPMNTEESKRGPCPLLSRVCRSLIVSSFTVPVFIHVRLTDSQLSRQACCAYLYLWLLWQNRPGHNGNDSYRHIHGTNRHHVNGNN